MTPALFAQYVRTQTKTNSNTFSDTLLLLYMNLWKDEIAGMLVDLIDEDFFGMVEKTDLVTGQREYPLPTDSPDKIKKVEAVLDPTFLDYNNNPVWVDLKKISLADLSQISSNIVTGDPMDLELNYNPTTDEDTIQILFGNRQGQAAFMIYRRSIWIFSGALTGFTAPNNYLKLWTYSWPADVTNLASTTPLENDPDTIDHGIPRQLHKVWADKVIKSFRENSDREYQPTDYENDLDNVLKERILSLTQVDKDESDTATQPMGGHVFNDGFDL